MRNLLICFLIMLVVACGTSTKTTSTTKTNNYKREVNALHPVFTVFHINDTLSELHFKIASKELLYMRPDAINFSSNVLISYKLVASYDSKTILDSASIRLVDSNNELVEKFLVGKMNFNALLNSKLLFESECYRFK